MIKHMTQTISNQYCPILDKVRVNEKICKYCLCKDPRAVKKSSLMLPLYLGPLGSFTRIFSLHQNAIYCEPTCAEYSLICWSSSEIVWTR